MTDKPRIILEGKSLGEYFEQAVENKKLKDELYTKEKECEELKETFDGLLKVQYKLADNNKKLRQCITEIKEIAEIRKDDINDWLAKAILQKISEVEDG